MVAISRCLSCVAMLVGSVAGGRVARRRSDKLEVASSCGQRRGSPDPMTLDVNISIVNGRPAPECSWPWQINIGGCGGTLIAADWVLSAAHCGSPRTAWAGLHNRSNTAQGQSRRIVGNYKHPQYNSPKRMSNDLMLLKLDRPFDLDQCVNTACLPANEPPVGKKCWITGWGTLSSGGSSPRILQEASVDIKSQSECNRAYGATADMVCASGRNNGRPTDACQGDSGGPLVCEEGGRWYAHGATSFGRGCADPNYPGVWSRAAYNQEWVTQTSGVSPPGGSPTPTPPTPPSPTPTPPTPPTPTPTPPTGSCVHETDCNVSPWCNSSNFQGWCAQQGQSGTCPAPFCKWT